MIYTKVISTDHMKNKLAFSLIELSIVILIIGILIAGVTQGSRMVNNFKLSTAMTLTNSSDVNSITGLILWLETTDEKNFAIGTTTLLDVDRPENNQAVGRWNSRNPNIIANSANNPTQATGANQPLYISDAINGLPALKFDGVNDTLSISNLELLRGLNKLTIFFVAKTPNTLPGGTTFLNIFRAEPSIAMGFGYAASSGLKCSRHVNTSNTSASWIGSWDPANAIILKAATPTICRLIYNGSSLRGFANGPSGGDTAGAASGYIATTTNINIGSSSGAEFFNNQIGEIIIFNRNLKNEEINSIENYLGKKWGIAVS